MFGKKGHDLVIKANSNMKICSYCSANQTSYMLPPAKGESCERGSSSINGGKFNFTSKEYEIYKVFVRIIFI